MLKPTPIELNPEARRRQKMRNWTMFWLLLGFVVLIFAVSVVKMMAGH
jgi:hypothetical protein